MKVLKAALLPVLLLPFVVAHGQSIVSDSKHIDTAALVAAASNPSESMSVTVWLRMHNRDAFDAASDRLYDPSSAQYHQWMSEESVAAYAPTAEEVAIVKEELRSHGLTLLADDPQRLFVRARGTVASLESTFHTQIGTVRKGARTFHANLTQATLNGRAGELTLAVSGLDDFETVDPMTSQAAALKPTVMLPQALAAGLSDILTDKCFLDTPQTVTFGVPTAPPYGTYRGNYFDPGSKLCGHTAAQIEAAYGIDKAHARGLQGEGQTIVLIEFYGPPTILSDVNAFSQLNGLPPLRDSQLEVVYPDGKPSPLSPVDPIFERQTPADVEWAHAMAPKAHLIVVVPAAPTDQEAQFAMHYAITHHLGSIISFGYSHNEPDYGPISIQPWDQVIALAAASGIAVNVATGDMRDGATFSSVGGVGVPADSPHATAVGGTSLGVPDGRGGLAETGYGEQFEAIATAPTDALGQPVAGPPVATPPSGAPFYTGTQGGESLLFAKPAYQRSLQGSGRLVPDVSMSGSETYLGEVIVYTDPALGQVVGTWGRTAAACSMFSGIWALANQHAHHRLGQAAPAIARMARSGKGIRDILPVGSTTNPSGIYIDPVIGQIAASPTTFFAPFPVPAQFFSALLHDEQAQFFGVPNEWVTYGWGLGGFLTTTPGWDNMTGYGVPNGMAFLDAAAGEDEDGEDW